VSSSELEEDELSELNEDKLLLSELEDELLLSDGSLYT